MKILITGARGQVGRELARGDSAHEIIALDRSGLDITDEDRVTEAIRRHGPDAVINAAAYTAVDRAESEPDAAFAVNKTGAANLARACAESGAILLHISTDYVFDGTARKPYRESDPVRPLGIYGKSKAEGESEIRRLCPMHIILRTSWVFSPHGSNFVKTMLRLALEHDELRVVSDQYGCPTSAREIAKALLKVAESFSPEHAGTYHFAQPEPVSWHGFAEAIVKDARRSGFPVKTRAVRPIATEDYPTPARRPEWSVLDCNKIATVFGIKPPTWRKSLKEVIEELRPGTAH